MSRIQAEVRPRLFAIRQARAGDGDAIRQFLAGLSPQSRYLRFFTGAPSLGSAALRLLTGACPGTDVVVATEAGVVIGHAMAADTRGPRGSQATEAGVVIGHPTAAGAAGPRGGRVTEIGVVVADARQHQGVGSALVRALAGRARGRGVSTITMDVLAENQAVLGMIARRWPDARYSGSGPYVTVHARLWPAERLPAPATGPAAALATA